MNCEVKAIANDHRKLQSSNFVDAIQPSLGRKRRFTRSGYLNPDYEHVIALCCEVDEKDSKWSPIQLYAK